MDEREIAGVDVLDDAAEEVGSGRVAMPSLLDRMKDDEKVVLRAWDTPDDAAALDDGEAVVGRAEAEAAVAGLIVGGCDKISSCRSRGAVSSSVRGVAGA